MVLLFRQTMFDLGCVSVVVVRFVRLCDDSLEIMWSVMRLWSRLSTRGGSILTC